jgi:hypothetical protein
MILTPEWIRTKDGDLAAYGLFTRHYTWRPGRKIRQFVGPGEKMVLVLADYSALFIWRRFFSQDGQQGINCAVFRNESDYLSSTLILAAERIAWDRWPGQRLFTYVNPSKIKSTNPGYCFLAAGWSRLPDLTKKRGYIILEKLP